MKNSILLLLFIICNHQLFSQDFTTKIAAETCDCIANKSTENLSQEEKEMQLGICMFQGISKYKADFDEYFNGKSITEIDMEKFGEEVGVSMVVYCPDIFLKYVDPQYLESEDEINVELGKITGIEKKQFNVVNLEIGDGSVLKFLWLWDFEDSSFLIDNKYKDKWVNIYYHNYPLYDPEKKTYVLYKVIEGMELGE